jgi:hypothetical protein
MDRQRILLANELRSYRQTMAIALQGLRPAAEVTAIEPENLEAEVERRRPHAVICNRTTPAVRRLVPVWVELDREHDASVSHVGVYGVRSKVVVGLDLSDVLSIIDEIPVFPGPAT